MRRFVVAALTSTSLMGLTCSVPTPKPSAPAAAQPVAAAPPPAPTPAPVAPPAVQPVAATPAAVPAPAPAAVPLRSQLEDAIAQRFTNALRSHMTASEIDAVACAIIDEARRHDLDPHLVVAVIHVESHYDAFALSHKGAVGLMQILPSTGEQLARRLGVPWKGPKTLLDPVVNVRLGVAYLKQLSDRYGNTNIALAAYNWGPNHIDRRLRKGTPLPRVYPQRVADAPRLPVDRQS
jgi:soluble lytic murein transglycosylase-like protein